MTWEGDATIAVDYTYNGMKENELYDLLDKVVRLTRIAASDIRGWKRTARFVEARKLYIAAACALYPQRTLGEIGTVILKDHAVVIHHRDDMKETMKLKDAKSRKLTEMYRILVAG